MEAAKNGLERIVTSATNLKYLLDQAQNADETDEEKEAFTKVDEYVKKFEEAMEDDFNTADAISAIFELVKYVNTNASAANSKQYLNDLYADIMGIIIEKEEELLDADIEKLIQDRQDARKAKDFAKADAIRNELLEKGIILEDTREGVKWKRA